MTARRALEPADDLIALVRAGNLSGRAPQTLRRHAQRGTLKAEKTAKTWLTTRRWLHEYLEAVANGPYAHGERPADYVPPEPAPLEFAARRRVREEYAADYRAAGMVPPWERADPAYWAALEAADMLPPPEVWRMPSQRKGTGAPR